MSTYFLYECSLGYALFEILGYEEITQNSEEFQQSIMDYKKVSKIIKKIAFMPFKTSEQALENTKMVNDCEISPELKSFLKEYFPKNKSDKNKLGCVDKNFSQKISELLNIKTVVGEFLIEIQRAIRVHISKFLGIDDTTVTKSELGLAHAYSRFKCMFDVNRQDKPVIQSIALIDLLDKDINSFCMRIKEWFSWHFPELGKIISDNYLYIRIVNLIEQRKKLIENKDELKPKLDEITLDPEISKQIIDSALISMGSDISQVDLLNIKYFSDRVDNLIKYREKLSNYLREKTQNLAPNTSALVGETVTARLISHSGSLSTLAKYPASTIQILGAEKALFRALKTRSATPKYGLLYHSSFIGKAKMKNKGKISRYLANKLAMCSRIDAFSKDVSNDYGNELRNQIDERLKYLDSGDKPRKNIDVMKKVEMQLMNKKRKKPDEDEKKDKKIKDESSDDESSEEIKKKKKDKKKKKKEESDEDMKKEESSEDEKEIKKKKKSTKKEVKKDSDDEE
jgi:nucleolar protein 56